MPLCMGKVVRRGREREREIGVCVRELKQRFEILFYKKGERERENIKIFFFYFS